MENILNLFSKKELSKRLIEESPKLKALKEILVEISGHDDQTSKEISVLITATDDRTCLQIKQVSKIAIEKGRPRLTAIPPTSGI
jgi:hypothetical protein